MENTQNKITESIILEKTHWRLVLFTAIAVVFLIFFAVSIPFYLKTRISKRNHFLLFWLFFESIVIYGFWAFRFQIRDALEYIFKTDSKVELTSQGVLIIKNNKAYHYQWSDIVENDRLVVEEKSLYEASFQLKDLRSFKVLDDKNWSKFKVIEKWADTSKLNKEIDYCRIDPKSGEYLLISKHKHFLYLRRNLRIRSK